jgi:hypothetical protein
MIVLEVGDPGVLVADRHGEEFEQSLGWLLARHQQ